MTTTSNRSPDITPATPRASNRTDLAADVESRERPNLNHERQRREGFLTRMVKAPFRFAWKHPVITTLGVVAGALWGVPWLARQIGNVEGGLSSVPLNRMVDHFRRGTAPLSNTMPPVPLIESATPGIM
jgi:hypothetical protein